MFTIIDKNLQTIQKHRRILMEELKLKITSISWRRNEQDLCDEFNALMEVGYTFDDVPRERDQYDNTRK
jgi:hypothetical protein